MATPAEYGIPYENLELLTADKVTLRCYLLPQRWNLDETHAEATEVPGNTYTTDDEVCVRYTAFLPFCLPLNLAPNSFLRQPPTTLLSDNTVHYVAADGDHVSWERRKRGTQDSAREGDLHENEM